MKKKWMGRLFAAGLCALTAASASLTVWAAEPITVKECDNLVLTLPDNMTAVTRAADRDDPYFARHNISYDEVMDAFHASDSYLQAMDDDNTITLTLSYLSTGAKDFKDMNDEQLADMARSFLGSTDLNVQYNACTQDEAGQEMVWLFLNTTVSNEDGSSFTQYQATTVSGGQNITLTLYRNVGDVLPEDYTVLESVAKTVEPPQVFPLKRILPLVLMIVGLAAAVVLVVLLIKVIRSKEPAKEAAAVKTEATPVNSKQKTKNEKILEELASKVPKRAPLRVFGDDGSKAAAPAEQTADAKSEKFELKAQKPAAKPEKLELKGTKPAAKPDIPETAATQTAAEPEKPAEQAAAPAEEKPAEPQRKYSDEDIERLLAD